MVDAASPARILVLDHTGETGGAEIALARLLSVLPSRFETTTLLFSDGPFARVLTEQGSRVRVLPMDPDLQSRSRNQLVSDPVSALQTLLDTAGFARRLAREIRSSRVDLVVANSLKSAVIGAVSCRLARIPWIWHLHDRLSADYLPGTVARLMRLIARFGPRAIVANSLDTAAQLGPGAHRRTVIAYPGVPNEAFVEQAEPRVTGVIGMLGRISETKGQLEFVRCAAAVLQRHPVARFRIVGDALFNDAPYLAEVRRVVEELGLQDVIEMPGWSSQPLAEIDGFQVLVHASPVPEPFGQVVAESMARGTPVIATQGGGVTEIVTEGASPVSARGVIRTEVGQLVAPGDIAGLAEAVEWALDHPALVGQMAVRALESARRRFSLESTARIVAQCWDDALPPRRW